ncbi:hypothetical protein M2475_001629 [Breznakia sp. PF5-3]|uniref:hypothetical protein n=1 Tax=unclassified Breznakia TaxID=2623764 RepID=UPI002405EC35|nr:MULTISPECIES: hypothetical protein [unclassified Breznakia]MDF9825195.1 hypothetical protein [Breznakia sp. PM6-1]MDF9836053.1 hypothetical protein [Breznakia sp. PF5-3]MDF9838869.1 hypothetical protein [Breznakia sp. PFB2-8]MDF9860895.1 hypothetical protein [Breznakia sp. PH5-24]
MIQIEVDEKEILVMAYAIEQYCKQLEKNRSEYQKVKTIESENLKIVKGEMLQRINEAIDICNKITNGLKKWK